MGSAQLGWNRNVSEEIKMGQPCRFGLWCDVADDRECDRDIQTGSYVVAVQSMACLDMQRNELEYAPGVLWLTLPSQRL